MNSIREVSSRGEQGAVRPAVAAGAAGSPIVCWRWLVRSAGRVTLPRPRFGTKIFFAGAPAPRAEYEVRPAPADGSRNKDHVTGAIAGAGFDLGQQARVLNGALFF